MGKIYRAIGMMTGTSSDGIDAAIIETDGKNHIECKHFKMFPYDATFQAALLDLMSKQNDINRDVLEQILTEKHSHVIRFLLSEAKLKPKDIDVVGFHGQTIYHNAKEGVSDQLGDGKRLAELTGIDVVYNLREEDIKHGGEGAPLVPIFHLAMANALKFKKPVAIQNIGGVANVTWIGSEDPHDMIAFDTGPGNAYIDDICKQHFINLMLNGKIAESGKVHEEVVDLMLGHPFFDCEPPKSLDRNEFSLNNIRPLDPEDQVATLTAFTAKSIAKSAQHFPKPPKAWYLCGGGRHNQTLFKLIEEYTGVPVTSIDDVGIDGDAVEAYAFGYLAVRSMLQLPNSFPNTTGADEDVSGGVLCQA